MDRQEDLAEASSTGMNTVPLAYYFDKDYMVPILENESLDTAGFSGAS
jgi:hypothetical protein